MTRLALLRHGDTAWSVEGRIQGRTDTPLLQGPAIHLPEGCKGMRVVTSPLARCVQTAALLGFPQAAREPRIVEMSWGDWEGETLAALRARLGEEMRANEARGLDFRPANGESPREVAARVGPWLREVAAARVPTLAITHKGVIRAILAEASGWDMIARPATKLDWRAVHLFTLDRDGKPSVERLNAR